MAKYKPLVVSVLLCEPVHRLCPSFSMISNRQEEAWFFYNSLNCHRYGLALLWLQLHGSFTKQEDYKVIGVLQRWRRKKTIHLKINWNSAFDRNNEKKAMDNNPCLFSLGHLPRTTVSKWVNVNGSWGLTSFMTDLAYVRSAITGHRNNLLLNCKVLSLCV